MELPEEKTIVKKRHKNFKEIEVDILLELVDQNNDTIECKKTDKLSQKEKENVWKRIEEDFNKRNIYVFRDWKTLKVKYDNIKKVSKKASDEDKKYIRGTGGGPSKSLLTNTRILYNEIGFDTKCGVSAPVSSSLNTSKKKISSYETSVAGKRMEDLTKAKLELAQLQKTVFEEQREIQCVEHELKVKCMEEEHELKMKNDNEEHFLKIAILKLKLKQAEQELSASKIV